MDADSTDRNPLDQIRHHALSHREFAARRNVGALAFKAVRPGISAFSALRPPAVLAVYTLSRRSAFICVNLRPILFGRNFQITAGRK
jgi:hypothetical protein